MCPDIAVRARNGIDLYPDRPNLKGMATRRTHRIVNALALLIGVPFALLLPAYIMMMAMPGLFFAHSGGDGRITFHAASPMPQDAAQRAAADGWEAMQDTPFGRPDHGIDVYITEGGWRDWVYFRVAPYAGGLTYPILSRRNVFLSGVNFEAGRLVKDDFTVPPPRDLTYYLVHEITHLRHAEVVGPARLFYNSFWIREGVADLAALGPASPEMIERAEEGLDLPRLEFGSYPLERVCVTMALDRPDMDLSRLFELRMPMHDARACPTLPPRDSD